MYDTLRKLFGNDRVFPAAALISVIGWLLRAECALMPIFSDFPAAMNFLLCGGCMLTIYISCRRDSINVMKGMMDALLALTLSNAFSSAGSGTATESLLSAMSILALGMLFIGHFLHGSSRYSDPGSILLSRISVPAVMAVQLCRFFLLFSRAHDALQYADALLFLLSELSFAAAVIYIELRLDAYRTEHESECPAAGTVPADDHNSAEELSAEEDKENE